MTKILLLFLVAGIAAAVIAGVWQHLLYLRVRRERVEDRQSLIYAGATFHTVTLLEVEASEGREEEPATLRALRNAIEAHGATE